MPLTIDLPPELERALKERAGQRGQSVPEYVAGLLSQATCTSPESRPTEPQADIAERLAALQRIGSYRTRTGLPPLSDDAVAESYREREDAQL